MNDTDMPQTGRFGDGDALLVVDVQSDFCPGGTLPVPEGDDVVPVLNRWIEAAADNGAAIVASRDWHPLEHISFSSRGGQWPEHCVQGTPGAAFHPDLRLPEHAEIISKGRDPERDQYSAFDGTGLADRLRALGVTRVWIGGLAQDVCVRATAIDAARAGFDTRVIVHATRAVDPEAGEGALGEMESAGVRLERGGVESPGSGSA